jgi:hypothetical protein
MPTTVAHPLTFVGRLDSDRGWLDARTVRPARLASAYDLVGATLRVDRQPWRVVSVLGPCQGPHFTRFPDFLLLSPAGDLHVSAGVGAVLAARSGARMRLSQGYLGVTVQGDVYFSAFDVELDDGRVGTLGKPVEILSQDDPFCPDVLNFDAADGVLSLICRDTTACAELNSGHCVERVDSQGVPHCVCQAP